MVIKVVKKRQFWVVIIVVTKRQFLGGYYGCYQGAVLGDF